MFMQAHSSIPRSGLAPRARSLAWAILLVGAGAAAAARAESKGVWVPISPNLGMARAVAFDPRGSGTAYAVFANSAVFASADRGATWSRAGELAGSGRIDCLAVSPGGPAVVYACRESGLLRSEDGGASWVTLAGAGTDIFRMAIAPADPLTIYAGGNGATNNNTVGGMLRSTDGGATWTSISPAPFAGVSAIAVDPADPATVYLGGPSFWTSHDGGASWTTAGPQAYPLNGALQILVDPRVRTTLYVVDGTGAVEQSDDGGQSWTLSGVSAELGLGQGGSGTLYTVDQFGEVWWRVGAQQPWQQRSSLAPALDPALVAAREFPVTVLAVDPGSEVLLVGIYAEGLLRSTAGLSFAPPAGVAALDVLQLVHVAAAPGAGAGKLFAVAITGDVSEEPAVSRSLFMADEGTSVWHFVSINASGLPEPSTDLRTPFVAYDATGGLLYLIQAFSSDFLVSPDRGANWSTRTSSSYLSLLADLAAAPGQAGTLLGVNASPSYTPPPEQLPIELLDVASSADGGASWSQGGAYRLPLPPGLYATDTVPVPVHLLLDPASPSELYLATSQLLKSADGGATLSALALPGPLAAAAIDPVAPRTLYAAIVPSASGTGGPIVYKTTDGGATWAPVSRGLPGQATASALAVDPSAPATVYLATDRGVFVTRNGGRTWKARGAGLAGQRVTTFAFAPGNGRSTVYAGTEGAGIFMLKP